MPLFAAFFLYILFSNWSGLIPPVGKIEELRAPTSDVNITVGLALVAFVFTSHRRAAVLSAGVFAAGLVLFMGWSWREFHALLPWYYAGGRLGIGRGPDPDDLAGHHRTDPSDFVGRHDAQPTERHQRKRGRQSPRRTMQGCAHANATASACPWTARGNSPRPAP